MADKIPELIQPLLDDFLAEVNQTLPGLLNGFYLYGSIALGNFHPTKSDVDFVAILNRPATENEIAQLSLIHERIHETYPAHQMDGSYLQKSDIGKLPDEMNPHPYFNGELHPTGHYEINLVTWWILKNHGITIYGEDICEMNFSVGWDVLREAMHENLNSYWHKWAYSPEYFVYLFQDNAIEWAVLGILRLYYSFCEDAIASKSEAGLYAFSKFHKQWRPIIHEAMQLRNDEPSVYKNKLRRQQEARQFLRFVIDECNRILE